MAFLKHKFSFYTPMIAGVIFAFGIGITVIALQQQQEIRSRAVLLDPTKDGGGTTSTTTQTGTNCKAAGGACVATAFCSGGGVVSLGRKDCKSSEVCCKANHCATVKGTCRSSCKSGETKKSNYCSAGVCCVPGAKPVVDTSPITSCGCMSSSVCTARGGVKTGTAPCTVGNIVCCPKTPVNPPVDDSSDDKGSGISSNGDSGSSATSNNGSGGSGSGSSNGSSSGSSSDNSPDDDSSDSDSSTETINNIAVKCTSTGQICTPAFVKKVTTNSVLKVKYTVGSGHCSYTKIHFYLDGKLKKTSDWLGWPKAPAPDNKLPLSTPEFDLGPVSPGEHTLELKAEGKVGGCNKGKVISWGGSLSITTSEADTKLALDLLLHGIGKAGDSIKPGVAGGGNLNPEHADREVTVNIFTSQDVLKLTKTGELQYDSGSGSFKGEVDLGSALPNGSYVIKVKLKQSLETQIGTVQTITAGAAKILPQTSLITGDIDNNNGREPDIRDYNMLLDCFDSCSEEQSIQADLDDNGEIDQFDYNLFIRELGFVTEVD